MKKIKTKNYLQAYYGSDQTTSCPVRVVLNKVEEPPALKEQHKRKGLYALGSN